MWVLKKRINAHLYSNQVLSLLEKILHILLKQKHISSFSIIFQPKRWAVFSTKKFSKPWGFCSFWWPVHRNSCGLWPLQRLRSPSRCLTVFDDPPVGHWPQEMWRRGNQWWPWLHHTCWTQGENVEDKYIYIYVYIVSLRAHIWPKHHHHHISLITTFGPNLTAAQPPVAEWHGPTLARPALSVVVMPGETQNVRLRSVMGT